MLLLEKLNEASESPHKLALLRMECLGGNYAMDGNHGTATAATSLMLSSHNREGLAKEFVDLLVEGTTGVGSVDEVHERLLHILTLLRNVTSTDITLAEEIGRYQETHRCLRHVATMHDGGGGSSKRQQPETQMQILVTEIQASLSSYRPHCGQPSSAPERDAREDLPPYSRSELQSRLPLSYGLPQHGVTPGTGGDELLVMVHQVTDDAETDTHDVGFVMWPSAIMLSRWMARHPSIVLDCCSSDSATSGIATILELGAGCGLVGVTAAALLNQHYRRDRNDGSTTAGEDGNEGGERNRVNVILTDYLPTILENLERNLLLNGLNDNHRIASVSGLDFFDQPGNSDYNGDDADNESPASGGWIDMEGVRRPQVQLILGADIIVYSNDATMVANTIHSALVEGGKAVVMSRDRRFGVEDFPYACERVGLNITTTDLGMGAGSQDAQLVRDLEHTPSYNQGYDLIMFTIDKPMSTKG